MPNISIIVPIYNAESHIKKCLDNLLKQDFAESFEIILVNDASTDNSIDLIKKYNSPKIKLHSLSLNSGPGAARNFGIKKALGKYIYFIDVDDTIATNALKTLYSIAKQNDCDFVCADFKRIENLENQRKNTYNYRTNKVFENNELIDAMRREIHDPSLGHLALFGCNGRLIRRSIIIDNNILFQEKLRFLEDKLFCWDVMGFIRSARYVREQLYSYYVYPNTNTAVAEGISSGFPIENFKLIKNHIQNSFKKRGLSIEEIEKLGEQALIFHIIQALVSISRFIFVEKLEIKKAKKVRRKIINEIFADTEVLKAIKNYSPSKKESQLIPKAIAWHSSMLLEFACNRRAKEVLRRRRLGID